MTARNKLAAQYHYIAATDNPDMVIVKDDPDMPDDQGEWFAVIQLGIWWWKRFAVAFLIPGMAAGGINSDHWEVVSNEYRTREEARIVLRAGGFRYPFL